MAIKELTHDGQRASYWSWPGPASLYLFLVFAVVWLPICIYGGKSQLVMASATALTICVMLAYQALRGDPAKWTAYVTWVVRIGAAITAVWLFTAAPSQAAGFLTIAVYGALYALSEWAVRRSARLRNAK